MAYSLETFVQILEQDQHHANLACNPQIESLLKKARSLRDLCDKLSFPIVHPKSGDLESQIRDVVYKAEDLIESHIRDQVLSVLKDDTSELDLKNFMEEFDSIKEAILKIQALPEPVSSAIAGSSSVFDPGPNSNMVGLTEEFHQLLDQLLGRGPRLQIIPIVGMGGIGKTTLARQLFYHQNTVKRFDKRVWITFSQESSVRATLLAILGCLTNLTDEMRQHDDDQLGTIIRMLLTDQRYLIVVDDIWDLGTWDKIWGVCPANENCSRIILTTRVSTCYATCSSNHYQMRFMNGSESWELLCSEVFGEESFPPELEKVGKMIAERCQGLPLAIISMAKLLSRIEKKLEHWEHFVMIANSLEVHLDSEVDILSKSYSHLPCSLKPCFLYVGAFLGDHEIRVSRIVNLWIAEGFVSGQNLEDTAEEYLKALSDENLLLACKKEPNGRIRTFKIHSLLRKLCEKKAFEEKFLWFKHLEDEEVPEDKDQLRRVSMHPLVQPTNTMELASFVRSLLCLGPYSQRLAPFFLGLTLLRVLDVFQVEFFQFPKEILELVLLRYLSFSCHSNLPSSVSRLRNLQTIVIRRFPSFREFSLPFELWELTQLRHIKCKETCIWYFPDNGAPQENLQTLSNIQVFVVTDSLLDNMPNLRKLGLFCNKLVQSVIHLDRLSKLEKLKCSSNLSQATHNFLSYLTFPPSLRKLTLVLCKIPCGFMETVGLLPNLEQLKLRKCAFLVIGNKPTEVALEMEVPEEETEPTWEQVEDHDQFSALISLQMEDLNLVHWKANETHFPKLEHLIIRGCSSLRELPVGIVERSSVKLVEVDEYCRPSVIASAKDKRKKPIDLEDDIFQVGIAESQEASTLELFELHEEHSSSVIAPEKDRPKIHFDLEDDILQVDIGRTQESKPKKCDGPSSCKNNIIGECVIPYISDPLDRSAVSLVCRRWYDIDAITRKHITIALCYAVHPQRLSHRFPHLESFKLKGKPRSAMFNLIPEDWGGFVAPWVDEIVRSFGRMRSLHFRRMVVLDQDLEKLARSPCGNVLEVLKLDKCSGFSTDGLLHIGRLCRNMKHLFLEESSIIENDGEWLHEMASNNTVLEHLNFYMTDLTRVSFGDLELIARRCPSLASVKISECDISDLIGFFRAAASLEEFAGGSLSEPPCQVDEGAFSERYGAVKFPPKLSSLGLTYLGKAEMPIIYPVTSRLKKLDLLYALLDTESHCILLQKCPNLEFLETRNVLGNRGLEVLGQYCKRLKRLRVEQGADEQEMEDVEGIVSQRGLIALAEGCIELEYLAVYVSDITNASLESLGTHSKNLCDFRLVLLDKEERIADLPLDNGVRSLLMGCQKLRRFALYLRPGGLTDAGLSYIGRYSPNVRWMLLGYIGESDAGLLEFSKGCPNLQKLEMRGCCFSERALSIAALQLASLRYLWVEGYRSSGDGRDLLSMVRPNWNIELIPARQGYVQDQDGERVSVEHPVHILAYYSLAGPRKDIPSSVKLLEVTFGNN